jgi:hypothetical protein
MPRPFTGILLALLLVATVAITAPLEISPTADLRVRQEVLDGVYHFAPEHDRDWIRVRTRLGARAETGRHLWELRLVNEHRHFLTPDLDLDWDEVLVDRLLWRWSPREDLTVSLGRQDIIWPGGFLVLEGHPLDGSRTIFHDGVRLQAELGWGRLDAAVVHNQQRADLVLIDDLHRDLTLGEETGFLVRLARGDWSGAFIVKDSDGAGDLRTWTWSGRYHGPLARWGDLEAELAVQRQDGRVATVTPDGVTPRGDGWALAGQAFLARPLGAGDLTVGGFYYSGPGEHLEPFHAPWGDWPKWSELYIYTLLGESTPGRPHVAAWENVAAPRVELTWPLGERLGARAGASWLLAPAADWSSRGLLLQAELTAGLPYGLDGHLLYEWFDPGAFHDGRHGLPALEDAAGFLRWQVSWAY